VTVFDSTVAPADLNVNEIDAIIAEEVAKRNVGPIIAAGGLGANAAKTAVHVSLLNDLMGEFEDIRQDPTRNAKQMDQMVRTYQNYLDQGNNPVEYFIPEKDFWAAGQDSKGNDVVWYDPSAPHPAVMAHELGHVQMNHSNDPLSWLQTSGVGRASGQLAAPLGAIGAVAGSALGARAGRRGLGTAIGGALGTLGASGNFAYELGGASGRALGYLPEDVDQKDAAGDLLRAGMTYGMAGPGTAAAAAILAGGLANTPSARKFAGRLFS
jgi:hypothetical protein